MKKLNNRKNEFFFQKISIGIMISIVVLGIIFVYNSNILSREVFLYETLPYYDYNSDTKVLFKYPTGEPGTTEPGLEASNSSKPFTDIDKVYKEGDIVDVFVEDEITVLNRANENVQRIEQDIGNNMNMYEVIGTDSVIYQPETGPGVTDNNGVEAIAPFPENWLSDFSFLRKHFYSVNPETEITSDDIDGLKFVSTNMKITLSKNEPKVIIFHTHMYESFVGSDPDNINEGVFGFGELLAKILLDKYEIVSLHYDGRFDLVGGVVNITGAYERMEPEIIKILQENPSIEVAIDIHRDGVRDDIKLTSLIDGEIVAPIMFVNGLSKRNDNGVLKPIESLPNPFLQYNLAFSFQMQLAANELYPGFARRIYLRGYRYSLNMLPKSLLVEVGAQTNTKEEAFRAAEPLADILAKVILE